VPPEEELTRVKFSSSTVAEHVIMLNAIRREYDARVEKKKKKMEKRGVHLTD